MAKRIFRRRNKNLLALAISSLAIIYYLTQLDTRQMRPSGNHSNTAETTPQSSSGAMTVRQFNRHGRLDYTLTSTHVDYYHRNIAHRNPLPDSDFTDDQNRDALRINNFKSARIQQPIIVLQGEGDVRLTLTADHATIDDHGSKARLFGNVRIIDHLSDSQLTTEALTLDGTLQQVLTQQPVTLITPQSETHATGLQGNLTEQRWQLLSEVNSVIRPH